MADTDQISKLPVMTDDAMRAAIDAAYMHNDHARRMGSCNAVYMGSLAQFRLAHILGGAGERIGEAIANAKTKQLEAGMAYIIERGYHRNAQEGASKRIYHANGKQVLKRNEHYADARDVAAAKAIANALNEGMQ